MSSSTRPAERWRPAITAALSAAWPAFPGGIGSGVDWVEAQVWQESAGIPDAKSVVGAIGLMQLMPATAAELGVDPLSPGPNLLGGISYMRQQYRALEQDVPDSLQRYLWALACYNGGRGYIDFNGGPANTALELAQKRGQAVGYPAFWTWDFGKLDLANVVFKGRRPDWQQIVGYVDSIRRKFDLIAAAA